MGARKSTARSRDIGGDLAVIREQAGFDGIRLADKLGWDQSKVSRIEGGKQAIDDIDLITWLTYCKVTGDRLHAMVEANREATKDTWLQPHGANTDRTLIAEEQRATKLVQFSLGLVPGLLQTEGYTRAVLRSNNEASVAKRVARQEILRGEKALKGTFYIDEQVLRRSIGGADVMHDQLMHLHFMAGWRKIVIRVVPDDAGMHDGLTGSFTVFDERVVYLGTKVANVFLENPAHVAVYVSTVEKLATVAMPEGESRAYLAQQADRFGHP